MICTSTHILLLLVVVVVKIKGRVALVLLQFHLLINAHRMLRDLIVSSPQNKNAIIATVMIMNRIINPAEAITTEMKMINILQH